MTDTVGGTPLKNFVTRGGRYLSEVTSDSTSPPAGRTGALRHSHSPATVTRQRHSPVDTGLPSVTVTRDGSVPVDTDKRFRAPEVTVRE